MSSLSPALFPLGRVVATRAVSVAMQSAPEFATFVVESLARHNEGDWGDLDLSDTTANDLALIHRDRLMSVYEIPAHAALEDMPNASLWIISEGDRSATTVLWPSEY